MAATFASNNCWWRDLTPENSSSGKESPPGKIGHSKEGSCHGRSIQRNRS